jgi:hypothetical protein
MEATSNAQLLDPVALEERERDLTRGMLSLICQSTGRRRTPQEARLIDALVSEIRDVRTARRAAAHHN